MLFNKIRTVYGYNCRDFSLFNAENVILLDGNEIICSPKTFLIKFFP